MKKILALVAIFSLVFLMTSCQKPAEVTVTKYFQAMNHNDSDSMSSMAVEPKNLEYKSFKITSVSEPIIEDYQLPILVQELEKMKKDRQAMLNQVRDLQDEVDELNFELGETRRRSKKAQLKNQIAEKEAGVKEATDNFRKMVADMTQIKKKIEFERNLVKLSAGIAKSAEIYGGTTARTIVKTAITMKDGTKADYVFVLIKYELKVEDRVLPNRLIVLKIQTQQEFDDAAKAAEEEAAMETEEVTEEAPAEEAGEQPAEGAEK